MSDDADPEGKRGGPSDSVPAPPWQPPSGRSGPVSSSRQAKAEQSAELRSAAPRGLPSDLKRAAAGSPVIVEEPEVDFPQEVYGGDGGPGDPQGGFRQRAGEFIAHPVDTTRQAAGQAARAAGTATAKAASKAAAKIASKAAAKAALTGIVAFCSSGIGTIVCLAIAATSVILIVVGLLMVTMPTPSPEMDFEKIAAQVTGVLQPIQDFEDCTAAHYEDPSEVIGPIEEMQTNPAKASAAGTAGFIDSALNKGIEDGKGKTEQPFVPVWCVMQTLGVTNLVSGLVGFIQGDIVELLGEDVKGWQDGVKGALDTFNEELNQNLANIPVVGPLLSTFHQTATEIFGGVVDVAAVVVDTMVGAAKWAVSGLNELFHGAADLLGWITGGDDPAGSTNPGSGSGTTEPDPIQYGEPDHARVVYTYDHSGDGIQPNHWTANSEDILNGFRMPGAQEWATGTSLAAVNPAATIRSWLGPGSVLRTPVSDPCSVLHHGYGINSALVPQVPNQLALSTAALTKEIADTTHLLSTIARQKAGEDAENSF